MTGDLVYVPVPPALRRAGCLAASALYAALLFALALIVSASFSLNFSRIFADVSHRALATLLPHHIAALHPAHSLAERADFSNAFCTLAARIAHAPFDPSNQHSLILLNQLLSAARDRTITRAESAAFISNVYALSSPGTPPPPPSP